MGLLPSTPDIAADGSPRVVGVDSDEADALVSALSSETARRILSSLHEDPAPPSELADRVDTSLQNAQYHLGRLEDAGAVEVAGTAYSEKGREMDVFAPADAPLVIVAGGQDSRSLLRDALRRLVGGVGVLAVGALAVQQAFGEGVLPVARTGGGDAGSEAAGDGGGTDVAFDAGNATTTVEEAGAGGTTATPSATPTPDGPGIMAVGTDTPGPEATGTATEVATEAATATPTPVPEPTTTELAATAAASDPGLLSLGTLPPGAWFFLGGLTVLLAGIALTTR